MNTLLTLLSNGTEVCISMYIGTLLFVKHMNMFQAKANLEKLKSSKHFILPAALKCTMQNLNVTIIVMLMALQFKYHSLCECINIIQHVLL